MPLYILPENLLIQIGEITVRFALLHGWVESLIWSLISEHQYIGQAITAELSFKQLRSILVSLYKLQYGETDGYKDLKKLLERSEKLEGRRNKIVHSQWISNIKGDEIIRVKRTAKQSKGLDHEFEPRVEAELLKIADDLRALQNDFRLFLLHLIPTE